MYNKGIMQNNIRKYEQKAKKKYLNYLAIGDVRSMQYDKNRPNITRCEYLQALNAYMRDKNKTGIRTNM